MRPPKGRYATEPGPPSPAVEDCYEHGVHPEFDDPSGELYGLPTYPYHMAPDEYRTRRQLRKLNLCPGGQEIRGQTIWKHGGAGANGRGSTTRRVAYLFSLREAKPKRIPTEAQLEAVEKALRARRTCQKCGKEKGYYIRRSLGVCNECAEPELYANGAEIADTDWVDESVWEIQAAENDDPGHLAGRIPELVDMDAG
jgi:ribosomal protein S14